MTTMPLTVEEPVLHAPADAHEAHEAHGHEEEHDRPGINRMGLWLFMASESMLFFAMAAARFYLAGLDKGDSTLALGILMTFILLASSWAGYRAVAAISRGDRGATMRALGLAILLGILFIGGVAFEWSHGPDKASGFGTAFYAMTGLHVFHLATGLAGLILLANLVRKGQFGPGDYWGVTAVTRYWTFVDVMWLLIVFPVLYLL